MIGIARARSAGSEKAGQTQHSHYPFILESGWPRPAPDMGLYSNATQRKVLPPKLSDID